ncbi:lipase family protein [Paludibaculum fermentans]|uniref:Lipase family protein n=1 Tax=Paludibaculum fermentans TaxID=1473598 RepID=A0A7S7NXA8_PALFE|nr:lipase family protein [Paludibaculum fermentans]QOY90899.1 lipase family protein [Paludibaculum fermentans]
MKSAFQFDPNATEYTTSNAAFLCDAAAQAYENEGSCRAWAAENGFAEGFHFIDTSKLDPQSGTQGYVAESEAAILVAFRGTEPAQLPDVGSDLKTIPIPWEGLARVHGGFFRAFFAAWNKDFGGGRIFPDLLRNSGGRKIWITGHSLGGALAQICATQTELRDAIPVHAVYTYGQPRVGDEQFARIMNEKLGHKIFRLVNDRDIVPRVPLYTMEYRHYGRQFYFDRNRSMTESQASVETLMEALNSFRQTIRMDQLQGALADAVRHLIGPSRGGLDDGSLLKELEQALDLKKLAAENTEQIGDHLMPSGYKLLFPAS